MEKITLTTEDGVRIIGNWYRAPYNTAPAVLLLHMMPATKESWAEFAPLLVERGFQVLAIDERGHGESTMDGTLNYQNFSNVEQQAKYFDVLAARAFFEQRGVHATQIFVGGGSIGANLAIQYMSEHSEACAGFALSPGYNYCGIETIPFVESMHEGQALYLAAAKDDSAVPDSYRAVEELAKKGGATKTVRIFETGGHATNMFLTHPDLMTELADWLAAFLP